jgi:TRAP transporter TAXI family solute receptor
LSIGTNPQGSVAYAVGATVANISSEKAGLQMRVVPQGGPPVTIPMVNKGRLDFSVAIGLVAVSAYHGNLIFKERPQEKVRLLCYLFPLYQSFIVRKDSNIKTIADLKGKRIPSRFTKQKNVGVLAESVLATVALKWNDVKGIPVPNGARGVDDFAAGSADAAFFSLTSGKVLQANASVNGIRVLSIPDTPEAEAAMMKTAPGSFITVLEPGATTIPGITTTTRVSSQPFVITVSANVPEEKSMPS